MTTPWSLKVSPDRIVIHHSYTKDGKAVSWGVIRKYHMGLGWDDIGYHAGVELVDDSYEVIMGRLWNKSGAHCRQDSMNFRSLGLLLVGDFDSDDPPDEQLHLAMRLCNYWMKLFNIPKEEVYPHRHFAEYKSCPGNKFPWDYFVSGLT